MEIKEAIQSIAKVSGMVGYNARRVVDNYTENKVIEFANYIVDQYKESKRNKARLKQLYGEEEINTILDWSKVKAVEQDSIIMDSCIKDDLEAALGLDNEYIHGHLLLPPDVLAKKPETTKIIMEFGQLTVVFGNNINNTRRGLHCIVADKRENIIDWLSQFDEIVLGSGTPQFESFTLTSIKEELKKGKFKK